MCSPNTFFSLKASLGYISEIYNNKWQIKITTHKNIDDRALINSCRSSVLSGK